MVKAATDSNNKEVTTFLYLIFGRVRFFLRLRRFRAAIALFLPGPGCDRLPLDLGLLCLCVDFPHLGLNHVNNGLGDFDAQGGQLFADVLVPLCAGGVRVVKKLLRRPCERPDGPLDLFLGILACALLKSGFSLGVKLVKKANDKSGQQAADDFVNVHCAYSFQAGLWKFSRSSIR